MKNVFAKKYLLHFFSIILLFYFYSCSDDEKQTGNTKKSTQTIKKSSENKITEFRFEKANNPNLTTDIAGTIVGSIITVEVPTNTDVKALKASFTLSPNATAKVNDKEQTSGKTANDFTKNVQYNITAEDGTIRNYLVNVKVEGALSSENKITEFKFEKSKNPKLTTDIVGTIIGSIITVEVPTNTDVKALKASFTLSPNATATVNHKDQISGETANDFTKKVQYDITAEDGTIQDYLVTVKEEGTLSSEKQIIEFKLEKSNNPNLPHDIVGLVSGSVELYVPANTDVKALKPSFILSANATATVNGKDQISGETPNDFTNVYLPYDITAEDGTKRQYYVFVRFLKPLAITEFKFEKSKNPNLAKDITSRIAKSVITLTVPANTDVKSLKASFALAANLTATVNGKDQISGETANDFTDNVHYRITAEDGKKRDYLVSVNVKGALSSEKQITEFKFEKSKNPNLSKDITGTITYGKNGQSTRIIFPPNTDVKNLKASFTLSAKAIARLGAKPQISGETPNDFTNDVYYDIDAEDGTASEFIVYVGKKEPKKSWEKQITEFKFEKSKNPNLAKDIVGRIFGSLISIKVPANTDVKNLKASFTLSAKATAKVNGKDQTSGGTANDFTKRVQYDITAENGTIQSYLVTVRAEGAVSSKGGLHVGAIKMRGLLGDAAKETAENTIKVIDKLLAAHPVIDVIMTAEYLFNFFNNLPGYKKSIELKKQGNAYTIEAGSHPQIATEIKQLMAYAKAKQIHMILGTVPLYLKIDQKKYPNLLSEGIFNTTLIINNQGQIVDYDLKVRGSDWINAVASMIDYPSHAPSNEAGFDQKFSDTYPPPAGFKGYKADTGEGVYTSDPRTKDAVRLTNQTTRVLEIVSKSGHTFRYATLICAERLSFEMLEKWNNAKVDIVFNTESDGEVGGYKQMTSDLQKGIMASKLNSDYKFWKQTFYDPFFRWNVIDKSSYFVATDRVTNTAGIIRYDFKPIANLEATEEYVYAEIPANR